MFRFPLQPTWSLTFSVLDELNVVKIEKCRFEFNEIKYYKVKYVTITRINILFYLYIKNIIYFFIS